MPVLRLAEFPVKMLFVVFLYLPVVTYSYRVVVFYLRPLFLGYFVGYSEFRRTFEVVFGVLVNHLLIERTADRLNILLIFVFVYPPPRQNLFGRSGITAQIPAVLVLSYALG